MNKKTLNKKITTLTIVVSLAGAIGNAHGGVLSSITGIFETREEGMKEVATEVATLDEEFEIRGLDFSPDGKYLAATPFESPTVRIWDWQEKKLLRTLDRASVSNVLGVSEPIKFSPDGKSLAVCHGTAAGHVVVRTWNTETWEALYDVLDPIGGGGGCAIGFLAEGKSLIRVFDRIHPGNHVMVYDSWKGGLEWGVSLEPFHPTALSLSPDGKFAAISGDVVKRDEGSATPRIIRYSQIAVVDLAHRSIIRTVKVEEGLRDHLAWSPDGNYLAYSGRHGVEIFDTSSWERVIEEPRNAVSALSTHIRYTSDGKYFVETGFGEHCKQVRIWDGRHQTLLQEIKAIPGAVAVSKDGRYLAMGGNKKIIVWRLK